ncbi:YccF domain-containing protein [Acholeplasma laidlawii]|uniref:YccF domain-containing protein n=2 Tax=Acholeplasma laidlawii TaxID=2148 RepID=A0A553IJU1_ACHLA|nr:YccF domain-containing protein [Acholeplasma laidlawii]ABX80707.1 hypothetical membrane protein [Acholeplasma laidlawii PG-8A]NWH10733.1 YccF domain-containing protein [Acholeplasma laidlawii]NWH12118.1 YccF domain-containing protein [Acholeplasma laidlawii]NWH12473.1 YccF domain-containing protein [Acholeplasma laidlawii]NWH14894.1 YccF domain-containing protein [Acholeplasma laidlawii]
MKILGNIIWFIFGGLFAGLAWFILGILLCITIIGIPIGLQFFKFAQLVIWPFGNDVNIDFNKHPILNILWIIFLGWETALGYIFIGAIFCMTIIGIPFGLQWFKLSKLALIPFGATIKST